MQETGRMFTLRFDIAMASTAMRVVNAIPFVVDARPGFLSSLDIPIALPQHAFE
jgi:2,4-diaminopentanoate dehydrogenase